MSKVFLIQEDPNKNLTGAKEYGRVVVLLPYSQVSHDASFAIDAMFEKLKDFSPDDDFLLLMGDPVLIAAASAIVTQLTDGYFRVLKWDRQTKTYNIVLIDLGE